MGMTVIQKPVNIYEYPTEFEGNSGSVTIGDLHGNAIKLLHFLLRHNVIKFKDTVENKEDVYQILVKLYHDSGTFSKIYSHNPKLIALAENQRDLHKKKIEELQQKLSEEENDSTSEELARYRSYYEEKLETIKTLKNELDNVKSNLSIVVSQFNDILSQFEIDKETLVRLIGDELADRGSNDYFTLKIMEFLHLNGVKFTVLISNHSNDFITAYENLCLGNNFEANGIEPYQKYSFMGLKSILEDPMIEEQGLFTRQNLDNIVNEAYKPALKILDYTLSNTGITLLTHAPVRFEVIKHIANQLGVVYKDFPKEALAATIDKINTKFEQVKKENRVHEFCNREGVTDVANMTAVEIAQKPLVYILWNRWNDAKDTEEARPGKIANKDSVAYSVTYVHGHDDYPSKFEHVINLDTECDKEDITEENKRTKDAQETLANLNGLPKQREDAQKYLDRRQEKTFATNDQNSSKKHDQNLIDKEFLQENSRASRIKIITGVFTTVGLAIGIGVGVALVATGIFAPLGVGILGIVALAAIFGSGLSILGGGIGWAAAKISEPSAVNTVVSDDSKSKVVGISPALAALGGSNSGSSQREFSHKEIGPQAPLFPKVPNLDAIPRAEDPTVEPPKL